MNEYIVKDCIKGLKKCKQTLTQTKERIYGLQKQLWNETLEISGTLGVLDLYLGMLEREAEEESK